jgi:hypothetical protein
MLAPRSLKFRLTLFTLGVFVVGIWTLTIYISRALRDDMQAMLGEQQLSTVSLIADRVNQELTEYLKGLEVVASGISPAFLEDPEQLQSFLEQRPLLKERFNAGVMVFRPDGTAIAETPRHTGRVGTNYIDIDTVAAALKDGKSTVGRPIIGKKLKAPVFGMTVPRSRHPGSGHRCVVRGHQPEFAQFSGQNWAKPLWQVWRLCSVDSQGSVDCDGNGQEPHHAVAARSGCQSRHGSDAGGL